MLELEKLKKENEELKAKIVELEFTSKLNKYIAEQRAETIRELLEVHNDLLKKSLMSDATQIIKKMLNRIQIDNEKYDELQNYLIKTFPNLLKIKNDEEENSTLEPTREDLSKSYIDENGNMYAPKHIIDVAIILISQLKKQIEDILGTVDDDGDDDGSDIF